MEKNKITPVYIEIEPNKLWEVREKSADGLLFGEIVFMTYIFPVNLFNKGDYWFFPKYAESLQVTIGKTKEKAFEKFLDLYCNVEITTQTTDNTEANPEKLVTEDTSNKQGKVILGGSGSGHKRRSFEESEFDISKVPSYVHKIEIFIDPKTNKRYFSYTDSYGEQH